MSAISPRRIRPRFDVNGWLFVGPALALIATFMIFPVLHSLWMSFQSGLGMRLSFAGLKNVNRLFNDPLFFMALKNTFIFFLVQVPVMLVLAPAVFSRSEASVPLTVSWLALVVPPATLSSPAMTATASSCKVSVPPMLLLPLFSSRPSTEALPVTSPPLSTVVPKPAPFT